MKTRLLILLVLLSSLFVVFCAGTFAAANSNPTDYISLNKFYPLVPKNPDGSLPEYYSFTNERATFYEYIGQFRAFIPPGTVLMDLHIIETGKQKAVARHKFPPTGSPTDAPPIGYTPDNYFTLAELIDHDCWVTEDLMDFLYIASDRFAPPLESNKAGWLYVKVGGGEYSQIYDTHFTVRVNSAEYNDWWSTYIKDEAGWNRYVEGVKIYEDPTNPTPTPTPTPSPGTPAKPTADPSGGTEFIISPAQVKVTSTNATQIYYTLTSSKDGSLPAGDPPNPLLTSDPLTAPFEGNPVTGTGPTGTVVLPIPDGLKTMYKVKFQGLNASGDGEVSDVLQYTVYGKNGRTIKQADAKKNPGLDYYSDLIRTPDGLLDPGQKFLIPELKSTLSEYSVRELVLEYLKKALLNVTIELKVFKSGIVMIVRDTSLKGTIFPLIVDKVTGSDKSDNMNLTSSGNIEIIAKNILITLSMAGAYEDQLTQMMVNDGLNLEYGSDHMVVISSDSNQAFKLVYRYQFGATEPTPFLSGDNCTVAVNTDGTYKITYGNGTTQNLIPGVIEADVLINLMKDKSIETQIDPTSGYVTTDNNGTWTGLPYYYLGPPQIP
ncbi:MAG: hypothetical protein WCJ49_02390, partial [Deltaproteobacteria bacterium]